MSVLVIIVGLWSHNRDIESNQKPWPAPEEDKGWRVCDGPDVQRLDLLPAPRLTRQWHSRGSPHVFLPWRVDEHLRGTRQLRLRTDRGGEVVLLAVLLGSDLASQGIEVCRGRGLGIDP